MSKKRGVLVWCLVVSEGVARRRETSRVPRMCPECVRVFNR